MGFLLVAAALAAFNLQCAGSDKSLEYRGGFDIATTSDKPFVASLRIDLTTGRWCANDCPTSSPIVEVTPQYITLEKSDDGSDGIWNDSETVISRETGKYVSRTRIGTLVFMKEATCQPQAFSGLPVPKF